MRRLLSRSARLCGGLSRRVGGAAVARGDLGAYHRCVMRSLKLFRRLLVIPVALAALYACSSDDPAPATPPTESDGSAPDAPTGTEAGAPDAIAPPAAMFKSGTRIKIESVHADGRAFVRELTDTQLGVPCSFTTTGDGTKGVCLPEVSVLGFSDATCSTPLAVRYACDTRIKYALSSDTSSCGRLDNIKLYKIGQPMAGSQFFRKEGAACVAATAAEGALHAVDAPVTDSALVSFAPKPEVATPELQRVRWVGTDGTELVVSDQLVDTATAKSCTFTRLGTGSGFRCVPRRRAIYRTGEGPFSDGNCTTPAAAYAVDLACAQPEVVMRRYPVADAGACEPASTFTTHAVGAQVATSGFESSGTPTCSPSTTPPSVTYWTLGAEIDESRYPRGTLEKLGTGRLRESALVAGGVQLVPGSGYDTARDTSCTPFQIGADWYCVGGSRNNDTELSYEDAACTKRVAIGGGACSRPQAVVTRVTRADGCGSDVTEVRAVSPTPLAITQTYTKNGAACDGPFALNGNLAYAIGDAAPADTLFPKLTVQKD